MNECIVAVSARKLFLASGLPTCVSLAIFEVGSAFRILSQARLLYLKYNQPWFLYSIGFVSPDC